MRISADVDIDMGDRSRLLELIQHVPAAMRNVTPMKRHPSGIYVTDVPYDPVNDMAAIDYTEAEERGYFKIDLLNVYVYDQVRDEQHLVELMREPDWSLLKDRQVVTQLIHLNNWFDVLSRMKEPVDSIPRLAMFLAAIRPAKQHLLNLTWKEIAKTIWDKDPSGYIFRKSHAVAYAQLVVVHLNLFKGNI